MHGMGEEETLTVRAAIRDELTGPLEAIRGEMRAVGREADTTGRKTAQSARGVDLLSKAGRAAGKALKYGAAGVAAMGYAAYKLGKSAIAQASDLNESLNAVNVTYGKQARAVKKLGRQAAESLGLSNLEFNNLAVQFGAFAKTIGGGDGKKTVKSLDNLTHRASDFASVMNLDVSDAAALFQSGLAGESEPLRRYGIDLSAATVQAYAYANGIAQSGEDLTAAQKVQAAYGSLMKQTAQTQGDFKNTSDQLANSSRILSAEWHDAEAKLGKALLPTLKLAVGYLRSDGLPMFQRFSDWFVKDGIPAIKRFVDKARPLGESLLPAVANAAKDVRDFLGDAAPYAKDLVDAFNKMPGWAKKALVLGGAGAVVGHKLGLDKAAGKLLGSRSGGGILGKVASKAAPTPVWVVRDTSDSWTPGGGRPKKAVDDAEKIAKKSGWLGLLGTALAFPASIAVGNAAAAAVTPIDDRAAAAPAAGGYAGDGGMSLPSHALNFASDANNNPKAQAAIARAQASKSAIAAGQAMAAAFKLLPAEVQTKFVVGNVPQSRQAAEALAKTYDLTKAERRTLFRAMGIPSTQRDAFSLLHVYDEVGKPVRTSVTASGVTTANAQVTTLLGNLRALTAGGGWHFSTFLDGGTPAVPKKHAEFGGRQLPRRPVLVGEKRPEIFVPDTAGTIIPRVGTGGGEAPVVIAPGAIVINNPASELDIEQAIARGVRTYLRERKERA